MPVRPDQSSRGRGGRRRVSNDASHAPTPARTGHRVLVLVPSDPLPDPVAASSPPEPVVDPLAQLRAERDAALEEVAFLREQLRSAEAYHQHELARERSRLIEERDAVLRELALLGDELQRRARRKARGPAAHTDRLAAARAEDSSTSR